MTMNSVAIERNDLIRLASERGVQLTRERLSKWQRAGLIEPARIEYGQGRGARSYYTGDTLDRVMIITQALDQRRDLDYARLAVWRAGYPVNVRDLFERGIDTARQFQAIIVGDRAAVEADDDSHQTLDDRAPDLDWSGAPLTRSLHRRLSRWGIDYGALVFFATTIHAGDAAEYATLNESEIESSIIRALASFVGLPFSGNPYVLLESVGKHLQADNLEEILSVSGNQVLRQSDHTLRDLIALINGVINMVRILRGQQTMITIALENEPPDIQTFVVMVFHSMLYVSNLHDKLQQLEGLAVS